MHLCNKAKPGYVYLPKYEFMVLDFSNQSTSTKSKTLTSRFDLSEHGCLSFCIDSDVTIKAISRIFFQMYVMVIYVPFPQLNYL